MSIPFVVFIHGPTATGKTELAVRAAELFKGEIINCDSVQVYGSLDVGAAKPSREQLDRATHHLIGHVADGHTYTAGEYRRDALEVIASRFKEGVDLFFVVGGSGFYSQALVKGLYPVPPSDPAVRADLQERLTRDGLGALFAELEGRDPGYARKIGPNDRYRIVRALEVLATSGFSTMKDVLVAFESQRPPFRYVQVGLNHLRSRLRERVEFRTRAMLRAGLADETRALLARGLGPWPALRSVGYKECVDALEGRLPFEELETMIAQSTMQLAKRQMTWFRRDRRIVWFDTQFDAAAPLIYLHEVTRAVRLDSGLPPPDTGSTRGVTA
ncbi:MAG TPA: tRNA (adenosine(37)-N6)-dimethylallyltransferase MiaA [Bdellovibrionales bacterium]|nr:tRNA (adenosine(37)-N6)-dimethylallyltransferase MiaA [Bdellovibrionales bacterium]